MKKDNCLNAFLFLAGLLACMLPQLTQAQIRALAHYPLSATEVNVGAPFFAPHYTKVHIWDVSGNTRHGTLIIDGNGPEAAYSNFVSGTEIGQTGTYNYPLAQGAFMNNGSTCLKKSDRTDNAHLDIPNPYEGKTTLDSFSITFWYKNTGTDNDNILATPFFKIKKGSGSNRLSINYKDVDTGDGNDVWNGTTIDTTSWNFIAITFDRSLTSDQFKSYRYAYDDANQLLDYRSVAKNETHSMDVRYSESQILDKNFDGAIKDVRFFDKALPASSVNAIRSEARNWAEKSYDAGDFLDENAYAHYKFENNAHDSGIRGSIGNGSIHGSINYMSQGKIGKAVNFAPDAHITIFSSENFFGAYRDSIKKGFTVSFWTKINSLVNSSGCGDACPEPTSADVQKQVFFAHNHNESLRMLGMNRTRDWLGVDRYSRQGRDLPDNTSGVPIAWNLWQYDPVSFNGQTGWYHVTLVYHPYYMRVYLAKPGSCELHCAYNYFGPQSLSDATVWGLGAYAGGSYYSSIDNLDEFRVYNWPLTDEEVAALHKIEDSSCSGPLVISLKEEQISFEPVLKASTISAYPNPTNGELEVRLTNLKEGKAQLRMFDLSGKLVYQQEEWLVEGVQNISLGNLKAKGLKPGMFFLQVHTPEKQSTLKIVVQ